MLGEDEMANAVPLPPPPSTAIQCADFSQDGLSDACLLSILGSRGEQALRTESRGEEALGTTCSLCAVLASGKEALPMPRLSSEAAAPSPSARFKASVAFIETRTRQRTTTGGAHGSQVLRLALAPRDAVPKRGDRTAEYVQRSSQARAASQVLLVFANKQDLPNAMTAAEADGNGVHQGKRAFSVAAFEILNVSRFGAAASLTIDGPLFAPSHDSRALCQPASSSPLLPKLYTSCQMCLPPGSKRWLGKHIGILSAREQTCRRARVLWQNKGLKVNRYQAFYVFIS